MALGAMAWHTPCENCQTCTPIRPETARLQLDPNTATIAELEALPEIGPTLAAAIVKFRDSATERPAFRTVADLDAVPRIGPATIEKLRPYLHFSAATTAKAQNAVWRRSDDPATH